MCVHWQVSPVKSEACALEAGWSVGLVRGWYEGFVGGGSDDYA